MLINPPPALARELSKLDSQVEADEHMGFDHDGEMAEDIEDLRDLMQRLEGLGEATAAKAIASRIAKAEKGEDTERGVSVHKLYGQAASFATACADRIQGVQKELDKAKDR
eukprot:14018661-Alexandrium_andersonii.AAC.1